MTCEVPLGAQQEAFLSWMEGTPVVRHPAPVHVAIRVSDELDAGLVRRGLTEVVGRHEALRLVFPRRDGRRRAAVLDGCPPEVCCAVARGSSPEERLADARQTACRERERPFDLERGPLHRAVLIDLGERERILLLAVHHLVFDAWSMGVLLRELGIAWSALRAGREARRPKTPPMQCSEVVRWSRSRWPANRGPWRELLGGAPDGLSSFAGRRPTERLRPRSLDLPIDDALAGGLRATARRHRATPFMVVLAAWSDVLSSWSGATDLVLMSPVAGRTLPGSESAMGCLFSSLLIRVDLSGRPAFRELLARVRSATLRSFQLQDYPYHELRPRFANAPCVGFSAWRGHLHVPGLESAELELPPLLVDDLEVPGSNAGVPQLSLLDRQEGAMPARLFFNEAAFDRATVQHLANDLVRSLRGVADA